jgi:CRP-like cAMP-binding protein
MHRNRILASLSQADLRKIKVAGTAVPMAFQDVLWTPGAQQTHVHFPLEGYISLLADAGDTRRMEVGMVGTEGMLGLGVAQGVPVAAVEALVQESGVAWRLESQAFLAVLAESSGLRKVLDRYAYVVQAQLSQASACIRFHEISPRLARWLLMCRDRSPGDTFPMTQEFLSTMLGVRRVSVTNAASDLQSRGLIHYHRGHLTVVDHHGLLAAACCCYARDCTTYENVLAPRKPVTR